MKKDLKNIFPVLFITYLGFFISYLLNEYLATHLELDGLGDFNIGLSLAGIFSGILTYGGNASIKRFIPRYIIDANFSAVVGCLRYYLKIILRLSGVLLIVYFIADFGFSYLNSKNVRHEAEEIVLLAPLFAVSMIFISTLQALHKTSLAIIPDKLIKPGLFLFVCFIWLYFYGSPNLSEIILISFFVLLFTLLIEAYFVKRALPFSITSINPSFSKTKWDKVGLPLLYTTMANSLLARIDILSLEILHTSETEIGVFSLLIFIASIIWLNFSSICNVFTPQISEIEKNPELWQRIYDKALIIIFASNLIVGILICFFAEEILKTFSMKMLAYEHWLYVIIIGACINSSLDLASFFLRFSGNQKIAKKNTNAALILNLILTPILILFFGMSGAIIGLIVTNLVRGLSNGYTMKKYMNVKPFISF